MRVAVFGASGVIGRALLPRLTQDGHEVLALSRHPPGDGPAGVRWASADVLSSASVRRVLGEQDVIYHLVHSLGNDDFERDDRRAAGTVARAAHSAGARQIVFLGGLGDGASELSAHLRSRRETERVLADGPVPVTVLRTAAVIGAGSAVFETLVALVERLPAMICPRWVTTQTQPIALADIARYLAGACGDVRTFGETYDAGGPGVMTYRSMLEQVGRARGRRPLIVQVPVLSPRLSSLWLHLVTPVDVAVARPLVEGLRVPTVAHDERLRELVPFELIPFDDAVQLALAGRRR